MAQGNTVTIKLSAGESPNPTATFSPTMGPRQVTVGSGPEAQWKVRAAGVEGQHAELYWDGKILWVRDGGSRSGVYIGVERIHDWRQVYDGTEILFGGAVFRAQAIGPDARAPKAQPTKSPMPSMVASDDGEESTLMFSGEKLQAQLGVLPPLAPKVAAPLPRRPATMAPPARGNNPSQLPQSIPSPGSGSAPITAPTVAPPATSEATVIRQSPFSEQESAKPLPAAGQRIGAGYIPPLGPSVANPNDNGQSPVGERTMMATDLQQYITAAGPAAPPLPTVNGRPATLAPPSSGFMNPSAFAPLTPPLGTASQPPPNFDGDDPFGAFPPPATEKDNSGLGAVAAKLKIPVRTLVLAGGTLLVAVLGLFINPSAPATTAQPSAPGTSSANSPNTSAMLPDAPVQGLAGLPFQILTPSGTLAPQSNNILNLQTGPSGIVGVILPAPMGGVDSQNRPLSLPPANLQDPIRIAAESAAAHRYSEAAQHYEQLAMQHPEAPLFRQFAVVLRSRPVPTCQPGAPGCNPPPTAQNPLVPTPVPAPVMAPAPAPAP